MTSCTDIWSETMESGEWSISSQGRDLCQRYIIERSLKAGAQMKKVRMLFDTLSESRVADEVADRLLEIIHIMELLNPSIYDSCSSKLKLTMSTDEQVKWTYERITSQLLKTGISWGKLISIFTVCGALASDCVLQGHTDFLPIILDSFEESCSQTSINHYLKSMNGWSGVVEHFDSTTQVQRVNRKDIFACVAKKSVRLAQTISSRINMVSVAMILFFFFIMTISLFRYISQMSSVPT
ncbi:bcl-2-related ovarian killer protein homolog B-like [Watersipora subatra]|uniref:bcl-2-related ovarian killer protein homolog B-like n=1 Tax=Watersipora subatra TaxID=2589382 RepID=UPI00355C52F5